MTTNSWTGPLVKKPYHELHHHHFHHRTTPSFRKVFKRRGNEDPIFGNLQKKPKRIRFVMDVSSSMAVFNNADRRLDRMAATTLMIMEAFHGFTHKYLPLV